MDLKIFAVFSNVSYKQRRQDIDQDSLILNIVQMWLMMDRLTDRTINQADIWQFLENLI